MNKFSKTIHLFTQNRCFEQGVLELLKESQKISGIVARFTIFGVCPDNYTYTKRVDFLEREALDVYGESAPMVS